MDLDALIRKTVDMNFPLSSLLFEVKSWLAKGDYEDFSEFLELEINGYPHADETLPDYRKSPCTSLGRLVGPFQSQINNQPIPPHTLPKDMRSYATHLYLTESVSSIEEHLQGDETQLTIPWPASWIAQVQTDIIDGYALVRAHKPITRGNLKSVLQSVRSSLLDFLREYKDRSQEESIEVLEEESFPIQFNTASEFDPESRGEGVLIFISHSSSDVRFAAHIVDLIRSSIMVSPDKIRCTSLDGYRLSIGAEVDKQLRYELLNCKAFIALVSPNSIQSTYVLFEMGARWGAGFSIFPLLVPGAEPELLSGPLYDISALDMSSRPQLQQLVGDLSDYLDIDPQKPPVYDSIITAILSEPPISDSEAMLPFIKVDLQPIVNSSIEDKYKDPPISLDIQFEGIPFAIKTHTGIFDSSAIDRTKSQTSLLLDPPIKLTRSAYLLINSGGSLVEYRGSQVGEVRLVFSDGTVQPTPLILGENIREWAIGNPFELVDSVTSSSVVEVWKGRNNDDNEAVIDVLEIPILRRYRYKKLMKIEVKPGEHSGQLDFLVFAITIERLM